MNTRLPDIYIVARTNEIGDLQVLNKHSDFKEAVEDLSERFRVLTEEDGYTDGKDCTSYTDKEGNLICYEYDGDEEGTIYFQIVKC